MFIVGQYKCGTSWLLNILSAHPQVVGVAEFDIIRATYRTEGQQAVLASPSERLERYFDRWCPWQTDESNQWSGPLIRAALARGERVWFEFWDPHRPRTCMDIPPDALITLYHSLNRALRPEEAMDAFLEAASAGADEAAAIVLKAADQIAVFDMLHAWRPDAIKLAMIRDGRDAAISALQFRRLMRERGAPYHVDREMDYWDLLRGWANRAAMVAERAAAGQLRVIRYEDLTRDFAGTLAPVLASIGLDRSPSIIEEMHALTTFEAMTGRARGTEAKAAKRKGEVGEWLDALTAAEAARAWQLVGSQLSAYGYTENGAELRAIRRAIGLRDPAIPRSGGAGHD